MSAISVAHFSKNFCVFKKEKGLIAALRSFVVRKTVKVQAVSDISFEIKKGELVGFIGPNGAGKTTTLKCLSGLLYPSDGGISVLGFTPSERKSDFLKKISLVMGQKNQLWWDLPAIDSFYLNKEIYEIGDKEFVKTLDELSSLLEVREFVHIPVRQLSLGQRMKMELIISLLHKPQVLFLDEPTIGLDVLMQKKMRDFILAYNKKYEATILLTSHYMADVKELCKRVIVIDHGKIIFDGYLAKLISQYAVNKSITLIFSKEVDPHEFKKMGDVLLLDKRKMVLKVHKSRVKDVATALLANYPVEDLTIEEPEIEEVIRVVFSEKRS